MRNGERREAVVLSDDLAFFRTVCDEMFAAVREVPDDFCHGGGSLIDIVSDRLGFDLAHVPDAWLPELLAIESAIRLQHGLLECEICRNEGEY